MSGQTDCEKLAISATATVGLGDEQVILVVGRVEGIPGNGDPYPIRRIISWNTVSCSR